jgi:hypothetical protein
MSPLGIVAGWYRVDHANVRCMVFAPRGGLLPMVPYVALA